MFGETTISYVKIGNHPSETTIYKLLFGVPGITYALCHTQKNQAMPAMLQLLTSLWPPSGFFSFQ